MANTRATTSKDVSFRGRSTTGEICLVIKTIVWGAVAAYGMSCLRDILIAMAGKQTIANVVLSLLANVQVSIAWGLAVGAAGYGVVERKLRQKTVSRLEGRIHELESNIDSNRTSSHLTPEGTTNPGDR